MQDVAAPAAQTRTRRHTTAKLRRRRDDLWVATTALTAAMLALPFAHNSWNGPEVASVLAVSATAMLAGQRWAIALVVIAELLLIPTMVPRAFAGDDMFTGVVSLISVGALVPGLLSMRRAAAALILVTGWQRTQRACRRAHYALITGATLVVLVALF